MSDPIHKARVLADQLVNLVDGYVNSTNALEGFRDDLQEQLRASQAEVERLRIAHGASQEALTETLAAALDQMNEKDAAQAKLAEAIRLIEELTPPECERSLLGRHIDGCMTCKSVAFLASVAP